MEIFFLIWKIVGEFCENIFFILKIVVKFCSVNLYQGYIALLRENCLFCLLVLTIAHIEPVFPCWSENVYDTFSKFQALVFFCLVALPQTVDTQIGTQKRLSVYHYEVK